MIAALTASVSSAIDIGRDQAHEAAVRELTDPRYAADDPTLTQRVLQWVGKRITDLLERAGTVVPGGIVGLLLLLAAASGIALALWFGARAALRERGARVGNAALFDPDRPLTAAQHRAAAAAAEASGDNDDALREWFRAAVRCAEERGFLDPQPGRTADEAGKEMAHLVSMDAPTPIAIARRFDEVTFGSASADDADAAAARALDDDVRTARPLARR